MTKQGLERFKQWAITAKPHEPIYLTDGELTVCATRLHCGMIHMELLPKQKVMDTPEEVAEVVQLWVPKAEPED